MRYTTETVERKIEGPYIGKRFASMSDDVVDALLTIEYRFEGLTIRVRDISARWDRKTGAEYISGVRARALDSKVMKLAMLLQERRELSEERRKINEELKRVRAETREVADELRRMTQAQRDRAYIVNAMKDMPLRVSLNLPRAA